LAPDGRGWVHTPAPSPLGKELSVPIEYKGGQAPEPVQMQW